jgi:hypothetical protein
VFFWSDELAYLRDAASGNPETQDLWVRNLDAAEPRQALTDVDWTPPTYFPNVRRADLIVSGGLTMKAYDRARDVADDLPGNSAVIRKDGADLAAYTLALEPNPVTAADLITAGLPGMRRRRSGGHGPAPE